MAKPIAQAAGVSPDTIQETAQAYLQPTNPDPATMSPEDAQKESSRIWSPTPAAAADAPAAKERVINIMAAQIKISHDDAAKQFNDTQAKLKQTRDKAVQTAKEAADASAAAASKTAFAGFGVLLLGLIAAAVGGSLAVQRGYSSPATQLTAGLFESNGADFACTLHSKRSTAAREESLTDDAERRSPGRCSCARWRERTICYERFSRGQTRPPPMRVAATYPMRWPH